MLYDSSTASILYLLDEATAVSTDDKLAYAALEVCRIVCSCTYSPRDGETLCCSFTPADIESNS